MVLKRWYFKTDFSFKVLSSSSVNNSDTVHITQIESLNKEVIGKSHAYAYTRIIFSFIL